MTLTLSILLSLILCSRNINAQVITLDDLKYETSCSEHLLEGYDKYKITGYCGPTLLELVKNGWNPYLIVQILISGSRNVISLCTIQFGTSGENCKPQTSQSCYCVAISPSNGSALFSATVTAESSHSNGIIRLEWRNDRGIVTHSNRNLTVPTIYAANSAVLNMHVGKTIDSFLYESLENEKHCGFILTEKRKATFRLCCVNSALPCYPRLAFNGVNIVGKNSPCMEYVLDAPPSSDYKVSVTKSYSMCNMTNYITRSTCTMYATTPGKYPQPARFDLTGDFTSGKSGTIACQCDMNNTYFRVTEMRIGGNATSHTYGVVNTTHLDLGSVYNERLSFTWNMAAGNLQMVISNIRCSDAGNYTCWCFYSNIVIPSRYYIQIRDRQKNLKMSIMSPGSVMVNKTIKSVKFGSSISVECSGDVGAYYPRQWITFKWIIYINCEPILLPVNAPGLSDIITMPRQANELPESSCLRHYKQIFTYRANKNNSVVAFGCSFSIGQNPYPIADCENTKTGLCVRSHVISIVHENKRDLTAYSHGGDDSSSTSTSSAVLIVSIGLISIFMGLLVGAVLRDLYTPTTYQKVQNVNNPEITY